MQINSSLWIFSYISPPIGKEHSIGTVKLRIVRHTKRVSGFEEQ